MYKNKKLKQKRLGSVCVSLIHAALDVLKLNFLPRNSTVNYRVTVNLYVRCVYACLILTTPSD